MIIAIVEDEEKIAHVLQEYLQNEDYATRVFNHGTEALNWLDENPVDLILLDLMLPGTDGMSICRQLRKSSDVPIIMLTARVEEIDRLLGLELGADDYVCKPFSPREVVARVKTVLRRSALSQAKQDPAGFILNEKSAQVSIDQRTTELTAVELQLLKVMCDKPGQIFNRTQLMQRIYRDQRIVSDRTIDSHVKKLRQKLQQLDSTREYIHSVYGIGYKFELVSTE